jgi:hypothetical protein
MVIVVFGNEVRQVDEADRRTQPGMARRAFEVAVAGASSVETNSRRADSKRSTSSARGQRSWSASWVARLDRKTRLATHDVVCALEPQRFQIYEVSDLLRNAPPGIDSGGRAVQASK